MQQSDDNSLIPVPIASQAASGNVATIPTAQATAGDGRVSIDLGYPPECAISVAAGGKYPEMQDANGVYKLLSSAIRSIQAWGILPFNATFAAAIGGYPKYAVCVDSEGAYWVSTADSNTTTPGADGATWQSLFNGYATKAWANGQFLQLALATLQSITGPVAFGGQTTVPDVAVFTGKDALNAETADARYVRSVPATGGTNVRIVDVQEDAAGNLIATKSDGTTASYAPGSYGTFTGGYWIQTGNIRQIWWSQLVHAGDTVPFPLAFASAPRVFTHQNLHLSQAPYWEMGFTCIVDSSVTAQNFVLNTTVLYSNTGGTFGPPNDGVIINFYAVGVVS